MISSESWRANKQSLEATHPGYPNVVYFVAHQDEISWNEPLSRIKCISLSVPSIVLFLEMNLDIDCQDSAVGVSGPLRRLCSV